MNGGKLLLIVEDWESRRYLSAILAFLGFQPVAATGLFEASLHLNHESYAAVLIDQNNTPSTVGDLRECGFKGPVILLDRLAEDAMEIMHDSRQGDVAVISRSATPTLLRTVLNRLTAGHAAAS